MSNGDKKASGTEIAIFPAKIGEEKGDKICVQEIIKLPEAKKRVSAFARQQLFGRVKKSVRKKSAGIL